MPDFNRERLRELLDRRGVSPRALSLAIGNNPYLVRDILNGKSANPRSNTVSKMAAELDVGVEELLAKDEPHIGNTPDLPPVDRAEDYVEVAVLPTYAGAGGGGTGDGDGATTLIRRDLVVNELRAKPGDLLLIDIRGDSMEPMFQNGDQLLIDRRDTNPRQPGAFALWYADGYVVKNVEIIRATGKLRIFSSNPAYSPDEVDPDEDDVRIMGRPVWFARRL